MNINKKPLALMAIILSAGALIVTSSMSGNAALAAEEQADRPDPMLIVKGAKAWKENCGRCHNLRSPKELTDDEWDTSVTHMRVRANLAKKDTDAIRAFLKASN